MKAERYPLIKHCDDPLTFVFESSSERKTVQKVIIYTLLFEKPPIYNLALGDLTDDGGINDFVITDNGDMRKVIATTVRSIVHFLKKNDKAAVYIAGNSPSRTRLYRIILNRELEDIGKYFDIYGVREGNPEKFLRNTSYDAFVIKSLH